MKKLIVLFTCIAMVFASCKKDESSPSYSGSFKIGDNSYNVSDMTWFDLTLQFGEESVTVYSINGASSDESKNLALQLKEKVTGDIAIDDYNSVELIVGEDTYTSTSGTIKVTKFDDETVSGTFDATFVKGIAKEAVSATGSFNAKLLQIELKK